MTIPYRPFATTLARRERVGASFVRLTLTGDLADVGTTLLDQRVKLVLGRPEALARVAVAGGDWYAAWLDLPEADRPALRTYTLSAARPDAGEVDLDIVAHGAPDPGSDPGSDPAADTGPGVRFALEAQPGTPVLLVAPDRTRAGHDAVGLAWRPGDARDVLLVADETALPAVANIARTLPPDARGRIVVEVPTAADARDLGAPEGVELTWCDRESGDSALDHLPFGAADAEASEGLLWQEGDGTGARYGWVAGEAGWVRRIRAGARAAGVPRGQLAFMGYWRRGVAEGA